LQTRYEIRSNNWKGERSKTSSKVAVKGKHGRKGYIRRNGHVSKQITFIVEEKKSAVFHENSSGKSGPISKAVRKEVQP